MLSLSPAKILVVLVVALIVLGPEKLPQVARQMGAAWGDLRRMRHRLETEVRGVFPDLPPTHEVVRAVRSPLTFLDRLADEHERGTATNGQVTDSTMATGPPTDGAVSPGPVTAGGSPGTAPVHGGGRASLSPPSGVDAASAVVPDDPSMN